VPRSCDPVIHGCKSNTLGAEYGANGVGLKLMRGLIGLGADKVLSSTVQFPEIISFDDNGDTGCWSHVEARFWPVSIQAVNFQES